MTEWEAIFFGVQASAVNQTKSGLDIMKYIGGTTVNTTQTRARKTAENSRKSNSEIPC